jgi:glyceraldehyde-3-phosphate dehydrogenase (NADP+)
MQTIIKGIEAFQKIIKTQHYINNTWQEGKDSQILEVLHKYTQEPIASIRLANANQMEEAIESTHQGFKIISKWSAGKRAEYLQKLRDALEANGEAFVELIIAEAGKPRSYAEVEVARGLTTLEAAIRQAYSFSGEIVPMDFGIGEGKTAFTKRVPIGPIACITPFNFPLNLALHKIAPALAVGCSLLLKSAPQTPLTAIAFAELCREVGYPAGVVNVITCDVPVAEMMVKDERLKMLSFTGSAKVGWYLKSQAGKKKIALELGGNAAVVIDETADLEKIANTVAKGAFLYAGQICISTQRIVVLAEVYDKFKTLLIEEIKKIHQGNPSDASCINGPLIDAGNVKRIKTWVDEALEEGANALVGAEIIDNEHNIYGATLLENAPNTSKVVQEEVFGPVAVLQKAKDFEEALRIVNDSVYGLQVGIYTKYIHRMKQAMDELEVGGIIMNNVPGFRIDNMPYGGVKDSGFGREGLKYAMEEMTEIRLVVF